MTYKISTRSTGGSAVDLGFYDRVQSGQITTPRQEAAAAADSPLDVPQRAHSIGEPVPIVFARRRNGNGGILISPGATEARFTNSTVNAVTASYHLVLSEGQIDLIPVKDVFQRSCRTGTHAQSYNRRAGTWTPGNFIVARDGYSLPECPYYCGTTGAFPGISTLSFVSGAIPDGFDFWNRQVHVFVRGGMHVQRYEDNITGPSDSFADLYRWMLSKSSKVPQDLIDDNALEIADKFLRINGFTCNCWITESQNLADWGTKLAPYFLLVTSSNNGKKGLRPVLPVTSTGELNLGVISPAFTFNENTILPESFSIEYIGLAERQPFVAQMIWKQPLEDDIGFVRTSEVRIKGTAYDGPYESHDLSEFCTTETHAVRAGAYLVAKRVYTTHSCSFTARPGIHNTLIVPGSIIRVRLVREVTTAEVGVHDYLYQVERILKTLAGDIGYECTHFPINSAGQSVVALSIVNTESTGILMSSNRTGISCDANDPDDDTEPPDTGTPINWDTSDNPFGEPVDYPFGGSDPGGDPGFGPGDDPVGSVIPPGGSSSGDGGINGSDGGTGGEQIDGGVGGSSGGGLYAGGGQWGGGGGGGDTSDNDVNNNNGEGSSGNSYNNTDDTAIEGIEQCGPTNSYGFWYVGGRQVSSDPCYTPTTNDVGKPLTYQYQEGDQTRVINYGNVQSSPLFQGYRYVRWNGTFNSDAPGVSGSYATKWFDNTISTYMAARGNPAFPPESTGSGLGGKWTASGFCKFLLEFKPPKYLERTGFTGPPVSIWQVNRFTGKVVNSSQLPTVSMTSQVGMLIGEASGMWEFSNDKNTVLYAWSGPTNVSLATFGPIE